MIINGKLTKDYRDFDFNVEYYGTKLYVEFTSQYNETFKYSFDNIEEFKEGYNKQNNNLFKYFFNNDNINFKSLIYDFDNYDWCNILEPLEVEIPTLYKLLEEDEMLYQEIRWEIDNLLESDIEYEKNFILYLGDLIYYQNGEGTESIVETIAINYNLKSVNIEDISKMVKSGEIELINQYEEFSEIEQKLIEIAKLYNKEIA